MLFHTLLVLTAAMAAQPDAAFLDQHDPIWEVAPARWLDGVPLGNGDIGVMVWGEGRPLHLTLDKYDAWETREKPLEATYQQLRKLVEEGKREEAEQIMRTEHIYGEDPYPTRLPLPRIELDFGQSFEWGSGRLHLYEGVFALNAAAQQQPCHITITNHAVRNVILVRIEGPAADTVGVHVGLDHLDENAKATLKRWDYEEPAVEQSPDRGILVQPTPSGYAYAVGYDIKRQPGLATIMIGIASTEDSPNPVDEVQKLVSTPFQVELHSAWWHDYWPQSFLTIPDARLEALYWIEMYKLACSSRPGGYPATLQGVWTLDGGMPPWSGDYHLDMNVQQTYWPIYTANRLALGEPMYRMFSDCIPRWRQQCQDFFGFDGIWPGCAIGPRGERIYGYSGVELWQGNAGWLAHMYWLHFLYSQDKGFLKDQALPMMQLAFLTYANQLEEGDDGKLHLPLGYSPEYYEGNFNGYTRDPNGDLAIIRFLCNAIIESSAVLGATDEVTARAKDVQARLRDFVLDGNQLMISEGTPLAHSHRHHSHLMGIHPLGVITRDGTDQEKAIIRDSLRAIRTKGTGEWTGWAFPWMSLIASRAGYGNMAWQMLDLYASGFIKPNTLHINGDPRIFGTTLFDYEPMTLEAGFGAAAAIMEMLIQSYDGVIQVFPTLPDRWHDAAFENLRTEGAFLVSASLVDDAIPYILVTSEAGGPCAITSPYALTGARVVDANGKVASETKDGVLRFNTVAGGRYAVIIDKELKEAPVSIAAPKFERFESDRNFYGLKRLARF